MDVTRESSDKKHIIHPCCKSPPKEAEQRHKRTSTHSSKYFFGHGQSETLGVSSKPTKTVSITYTWKHQSTLWKCGSKCFRNNTVSIYRSPKIEDTFKACFETEIIPIQLQFILFHGNNLCVNKKTYLKLKRTGKKKGEGKCVGCGWWEYPYPQLH